MQRDLRRGQPPTDGQNDRKAVHIFSGEERRTWQAETVEQPGPWYFPPASALITAGGRLLLAMLEKMVTDVGGTYLMCDTDFRGDRNLRARWPRTRQGRVASHARRDRGNQGAVMERGPADHWRISEAQPHASRSYPRGLPIRPPTEPKDKIESEAASGSERSPSPAPQVALRYQRP